MEEILGERNLLQRVWKLEVNRENDEAKLTYQLWETVNVEEIRNIFQQGSLPEGIEINISGIGTDQGQMILNTGPKQSYEEDILTDEIYLSDLRSHLTKMRIMFEEDCRDFETKTKVYKLSELEKKNLPNKLLSKEYYISVLNFREIQKSLDRYLKNSNID